MIKRLNLGKIRRIIFPWRNLSRKKQRILIFTALLVLVVGISTSIYILKHAGITEASWWNDNWSYRTAIKLSQSYNTVSNYPVKVSLDNLGDKVKNDCSDIRVTDQKGDLFPSQVETCDKNGTTVVWFETDLISGESMTFYVYYGNSSAQAQEIKTLDPSLSYGYNSTTHEFSVKNSKTEVLGDEDNTSGALRSIIDVATNSDVNAGGHRLDYHYENSWGDAGGVVGQFSATRSGKLFKKIVWNEKDGTNFTVEREALLFANFPVLYQRYQLGNTSGASHTFNSGHHTMTETGRCVNLYCDNASDTSHITIGGNGNTEGWFVDSDGPIGLCKIRSSNTTVGATYRSSGSPSSSPTLNDGELSGWYEYYLVPITSSGNCDTYANIMYSQAVSVSLGSEEQSPGPVAYWKFDEGTGSVANDSVGKNNGSITGATWIDKSQCVSEKCLKFNGSSDYVSMSNSASLNAATGLTVEAWIKPTSIASSTNYNIVAKQDWGAKLGYRLALSGYGCSNNCLFFGVGDGTTRTEFNPGTIGMNDLGNWHHVVGVFSSGSLKIYVDGVLRASTTTAVTSISNTSSSLAVGRHSSGGEYFPGYIDDVKIYNYARTADQVKADFNKGGGTVLGASDLSTLSNGLVGYWKMDDNVSGDAKTITDASGNGNNGTTENGVNATGMDCTSVGKFGSGCDFDGTDDYVSVGDNSVFSMGTNPVTIASWVKFNSGGLGIYQGIVSQSIDSFDLNKSSGNALRMEMVYSDGTLKRAEESTGSLTTADKWYFVVGIFDPKDGSFKLFVDGVQRNVTYIDTQAGGTLRDSATPVYIGSRNTTDLFLDGSLDEARIYNRALSPAEVSQLYHYAPGPVAYYNFEEGAGSSAVDKSGTGNTGTWNGTGPFYTTGKYGKSGSFNGTDSFVSVSNSSTLSSTGTNSFTFGLWLKLNSVAVDSNFIEKFDVSSTPGWAARYDSATGKLKARLSYSGGFVDVNSSSNLIVGKWYYVELVVDRTASAQWYINGIADGSPTSMSSVTSMTNSHALNIGAGAQGFGLGITNGKIDEVRIYNYARTSGQITEDMNGGHPIGGSPIGSQIFYAKFDEGYGSSIHDSGPSKLSGTATNTSWTANGKFGKALSFNGSSSEVNFTNSLFNIPGDITLSAWIKIHTWTNGRTIMRQGPNETSNYNLEITSTGKLKFEWYDGAWKSVTADGASMDADQWYYVAAVRNGTTLTFYVNGKKYGNSGTVTVPTASTSNFSIGYKLTGYIDGIIDEVKIYNSALTAEQVKLDYNSGQSLKFGSLGTESDGKTPSDSMDRAYCPPGDTTATCGPIGEWKFEEGQGSIANDTTGNGYSGTNSSNASYTQGQSGKGLHYPTNGQNTTVSGMTGLLGSAFTVEAWVNYSAINTSGFDRVVGRGWVGDGWLVGVYESTGQKMYCGIAQSGVQYNANPSITPGKHFLTCIYDGAAVYAYIDGILLASNTSAPDAATLDTTSNIVFANTLTNPITLDNVRIFNYARSASQVAWDYNRGAPIAHYKLDECQGGTVHSSGTAYDASLNGTITIGGSGTQTSVGTCQTGSSAWGNGATGKYNSSLSFDGTDDNIIIGDISSLEGLPAVTLSAWINPGSLTGSHDIIQKENTYNFRMSGSNVECWVYDGSYKRVALAPLPTGTGTWANLTCTWSAGSAGKIYINGKDATTSTNTASSMSTNSYNVTVGSRISSEWFSGQIDDVQIFNYALTPIQVKNLYNQSAGIRFGP